jgi:hypothetical protein
MSSRVALILIAVLALLAGAAFLVRNQSKPGAPSAALGQPLLKDLKAADVAAVVIRSPKSALTVERKGERWTIAERGGFPADYDKVRDFVIKATALKIGQVDKIGEKDRARLQLDAGGTRIEFRGADGKPLAALVAGRKYFKTEPENPERAIGDGRYVARAGDEQHVYLIADPLPQASTKSAEWIDRKSFAVEKVRTLDVRYPDGSGYRIERSGDNADWRFGGGGEKPEAPRANSASYSLQVLELADIAPKDARPEDTGLAKPTLVTASTFDGLTYTLKVGKLEGENYYATVAVTGEPKAAAGKDAEERQKKFAERMPRERELGKYTLLIPKSKLEDTLKKRADLLPAKKDAKK